MEAKVSHSKQLLFVVLNKTTVLRQARFQVLVAPQGTRQGRPWSHGAHISAVSLLWSVKGTLSSMYPAAVDFSSLSRYAYV